MAWIVGGIVGIIAGVCLVVGGLVGIIAGVCLSGLYIEDDWDFYIDPMSLELPETSGRYIEDDRHFDPMS